MYNKRAKPLHPVYCDVLDLLSVYRQLVLEMCRSEHPVDMQTIQPHLDRIKAPASTAKDHHVSKLQQGSTQRV